MLVRDNRAMLGKVSDIIRLKAVIDTWLDLNQNLHQSNYLAQCEAVLGTRVPATQTSSYYTPAKPKKPKQKSSSYSNQNCLSYDPRSTHYTGSPERYQTSFVNYDLKTNQHRNVNKFDAYKCVYLGELFEDNGVLRYRGNIVNGVASGEGMLFFPNGAIEYEGQLQANLAHGYGNLYDITRDLIYRGYSEEGLRKGNGIEFYPMTENVMYDGEWKNDLWHGKGSWFDHSGNLIFKGQFIEGEVVNKRNLDT